MPGRTGIGRSAWAQMGCVRGRRAGKAGVRSGHGQMRRAGSRFRGPLLLVASESTILGRTTARRNGAGATPRLVRPWVTSGSLGQSPHLAGEGADA